MGGVSPSPVPEGEALVAAAGAPATDDTAPEISTRVISTFFRYFESKLGHERLLHAVERIGGRPTLGYVLDPENFVSLEYVLRVARILTEESDDPTFPRRAGEHQFDDPRSLGFAYYLARSLGSPQVYYRTAVRIAPTFNRVGEITIEEMTNGRAVLRYRSRKPEHARFVCEGRIGQLAGVPRLWGLPTAEARELECQVLGAEACRYELTWTPAPRPFLRGLLGGAAGMAAGALLGHAAAAAGLVIGVLTALVASYRAAALTNARQATDGAEASQRSMYLLQRRFEELRDLHAETEAAHRALGEEMLRRERAEKALIEAKKIEVMARLSGGVAHDFNNVLTVIVSSVELARRQLGAAPAGAHIEAIADAASRGANLTRRLLSLARLDAVEPRLLSIKEQIEQAAGMLQRLVGESVHIAVDVPDEDLRVVVDPTQLERVLMNLAANARDAMPAGGTMRISAAALRPDQAESIPGEGATSGEFVAISVADTGQGMDEASRRRAFEPYFTTKEAGKGTGLGLATCLGIARQAGGAIAIESTPGQGTTVRLYLPRAAREPEVPSAPPRPEGSPSVPDQAPR